MKGIKKTLMAGLLACTALNAQAEVSPLSYGVKVGGSVSSAVRYGDAVKIGQKSVESKFFDNLFPCGGLYFEYAILDWFGMGLEVGYMKQGGSLEVSGQKKDDDKNSEKKESKANSASSTDPSSISVATHGIAVPINFHFYPMGREEEEGILKITVGATPYIPIGDPMLKNGDKDVDLSTLTADQKKEFPGIDVAAHLAVAYEFPFGLGIEAKYGHGFISKFKLDDGKSQSIFAGVNELKDFYAHHVTLGIGYNFASLLSD